LPEALRLAGMSRRMMALAVGLDHELPFEL
jgi:hypothetical protein